MKVKFNNIPIRIKLILIMAVSAVSAMLLVTSALVLFEFHSKKRSVEHELSTLARVVGWNSSAALAFADKKSAEKSLDVLNAKSEIVAAFIYDLDDQIFAIYSAPENTIKQWQVEQLFTARKHRNQVLNEKANDQDDGLFSLKQNLLEHFFKPAVNDGYLEYDEQGYLHFVAAIELNQKTVGSIHLVNDLSKLKKDLYSFYQIIFVVMLLTLLVILRLSSRLQKIFSDPLFAFMKVMKSVTREKDYTARISQTGKDEFGQLTLAFNNMLGEIHGRDSDLDLHRTDLKQQVIARTKELSEKNRELEKITKDALQAKELAEKASSTKSDFLAMISHEIRTPMNGVLGMTELLIHSHLDDRQARLANTILRSANSLLGIINNILDFSKIEAGKLQLVITEFDLRQILEETLETCANQAHRKSLELVLNLPPELNCVVRGDSERLRQVIINLIGNAIKYTNEGEVQLKVTQVKPISEHKNIALKFEILDTGPGIELDQQQRIFESFTQTDGSITRRFGGTGLGLTISRQIVELMGAEIFLDSSVGEGSNFYFTLVFETSESVRVLTPDSRVLKDVRILVVDDNASLRTILSAQLEAWGTRFTCVANSANALAELKDASCQNDPYRIALLDWQMPDMDGMELASVIQNEPLIQHLFLIMLSSDSFKAEADQFSNFEISYYLNKPVFQKPLLNSMLRLLGAPPEDSTETQFLPTYLDKLIEAKILLAEDNPINQEVARSMLEEIGCLVHIVNNGQEAVEAVTSDSYDLILMDCHMPELDGMEATQKIRSLDPKDSTETRIPIVAITADMQKSIRDKCHSVGMDDYLTKPFTREQLQQTLEKRLPHKVNEKSRANIQSLEQQSNKKSDLNAVLNPNALDQLRSLYTASGENLLTKSIDLFLESAPKEIAEIQHTLEKANSSELAKVSHRLKSASATLGAINLASACESLEILGNQDILKGAERMFVVVKNELGRVVTALEKEKQLSEPRPKVITKTISSKQNRILIVDDDSGFRLVTSEALRSAAFIVDEANSGAEAIQKIKSQVPDLILLDAGMEGIDGFETCRKLRTEPVMADVPIVMVTGKDDLHSVNLAFDVGASDFIIKPLNYAVLIHRLQFILRAGNNTAELKNSKLQLDAAQRIARLGYWNWLPDKNEFTISSHLASLCHLELKNFDGTLSGFLRLVHPEDRSFVKDAIHATVNNEANQTVEYRLQVIDSATILVHQEMEKVLSTNSMMVRGTVQDITQQRETAKQIHRLAYFDTLTGLASRAYYQDRIEESIKNAKRRNEEFAFLFLDLDGFKNVNDSFGHNIGDQFLKSIARRLRKVVRDIDFAARLGGDEFCIIVGNISDQYNAAEVADRCLRDINMPLKVGLHQIKPRVSIGIAIFPKDGDNEHDLMKAADAAMYAAKQAGKQRYAFYSPEMTRMAKKRLHDEQMLQDAVEKNQFLMHYQPQISLQTNEIVGLEALIRWDHPDKGILPAHDFISVAENLSLIDKLDDWALRNSCRQMSKLIEEGLQINKVSVNISASFFASPKFVDIVASILSESKLSAKKLELEVTEKIMQIDSNKETFTRLRKMGVMIAVDDFGTGLSSLSSLKELPANCLKIDSVFVQDVVINSQSSLLLGTIFGLANALHYTLVAEGVETEQQALVMKGLGCEAAQGNFFSVPVAISGVPELFDYDFKVRSSSSLN